MKFKEICATTEDFSCPCCDATMPDFIAQDLEDHYNDPGGLYRCLRQWVEDGFARFAWCLLDRLKELEGNSKRALHASAAMTRQIANSQTPVTPS